MNFTGNGITVQDVNLFREMLYVDAVRGRDSTGIMSLGDSGWFDWRKLSGMPTELLGSVSTTKFFSSATTLGMCLFGHNRAATKGVVNTDNAHPFEEGNIVLMHNGTLDNEYSFKEWQNKDIQVDSQLAASLLNIYGVEETLRRISGAFTFIWFDIAEKKIKIIRNEERPLYMAYSTKDQRFYFASEGMMLQWVLSRNKVDYDKIISISAGDLYEFTTDSFDYTQTTMKLNEKFVSKWESYYDTTNHTRGVAKTHTPVAKLLEDLPNHKIGERVIMEVLDFGYVETNNKKVIIAGALKYDEFCAANFVADASIIEEVHNIEFFYGEVSKIRRARGNEEFLWQYTLINAKPYVPVIKETCSSCSKDLTEKKGEKISRIAQGKEVLICEECFQKSLANPVVIYNEHGFPVH